MCRCLALLFLCLLGTNCAPQYSGKVPPKVINGEIDLTGWDFEKDGPVKLEGDWLFAWEKFIEPSSWEQLKKEMPYQFHLPGRWHTIDNPIKEGKELSNKGFASYALRITGLKNRNLDFGVGLWVAGQVFILDNNGTILHRATDGKPARSSFEEVPISWADLFFTYNSKRYKNGTTDRPVQLTLLIHHSNYNFNYGGINFLKVGQPLSLVQDNNSSQNQKLVLFGIFLITGLYHLILFLQRSSDKSVIFFCLLCLFFALRQFVTGIAQSQGVGASVYGHDLLWKIDFTCLVMIPLFLVYYLNYFLPTYWFNLFSRFLLLSASFLQVSIFILGSITLLKSINYFLFFIVVSLLFLVSHVIIQVINRQAGAKWVLASFFILFGGFLNDLLLAKELITDTEFIAPFYMSGFILMQAALIAHRSVEAYRHSELLARKLSKQIQEKQELQDSNNELEEKQQKYGKLIEDLSQVYAQTGEQLDAAKAEQAQIAKELQEASIQLIQAEKLSGLGAMVSGIAHDINNPLNFIETARFQEEEKLVQLREHLLGLVPEGEEGDEFKKDLLARFETLNKLNDQIKTGVSRVTEISKSMRNASRADTHKSEVNLVDVLDESVIITSHRFYQFELRREIPQGIPNVVCNRGQIGQVVMNFLSNAADALIEYKEVHQEHKGIIQLRLSISNQNNDPKKTKTVQISVSDNGAGVPEQNRDKVLNAFFTTKAAGVGTGLGLAIAGKIALAHDGAIYIEDGLPNDQGGHGARFTLEFVG